jgi:hypothetical protein
MGIRKKAFPSLIGSEKEIKELYHPRRGNQAKSKSSIIYSP